MAKTHYYGIWYVPGEEANWLGYLKKESGKWQLEYRYRYFAEDSKNPFDGKDRKSWWIAAAHDDSDAELQRMLKTINIQVIPCVERQLGGRADFVHLDCGDTDPKLLFELGSRPWANIKLLPREGKQQP